MTSIPRWIAAVVVVAGALLAGCVGTTSSTTPATTTDESPSTECPQGTTRPSVPIPEPSAELTNESAASFASSYVHATKLNAYRGDVEDPAVGLEGEVVNRTADGFVVSVYGGFSYERCEAPTGVVYGEYRDRFFVNDTVLVRLNPDWDRSTNPLAADVVVECWTTATADRTETTSNETDRTQTTSNATDSTILAAESTSVVTGR